MNILTKIPLLGPLVEAVIDRFLPNKKAEREAAQELELEEAKVAAKGRMTPRMLMKYVAIAVFVVSVFIWPLLAWLLPEFPAFPLGQDEVMALLHMFFAIL